MHITAAWAWASHARITACWLEMQSLRLFLHPCLSLHFSRDPGDCCPRCPLTSMVLGAQSRDFPWPPTTTLSFPWKVQHLPSSTLSPSEGAQDSCLGPGHRTRFTAPEAATGRLSPTSRDGQGGVGENGSKAHRRGHQGMRVQERLQSPGFEFLFDNALAF